MAVGTVSSINQDNWQLVQTNTPTSGTTSSFSSLSGYKTYMLVFNNINTAASATYRIRFNSDTGNNYALLVNAGGSYLEGGSFFPLLGFVTTGPHSGYLLINDANTTTPKRVELAGSYYVGGGAKGIYLGSSAVTSIEVSLNTSSFSSGTISLYGIAA
jgi:hypothetical protein